MMRGRSARASTQRVSLGDPASRMSRVPASRSVVAWAGPWLTDERWWDPATHLRRARLQLLLADGRAVLVCCEHGHWSIEGWYD